MTIKYFRLKSDLLEKVNLVSYRKYDCFAKIGLICRLVRTNIVPAVQDVYGQVKVIFQISFILILTFHQEISPLMETQVFFILLTPRADKKHTPSPG